MNKQRLMELAGICEIDVLSEETGYTKTKFDEMGDSEKLWVIAIIQGYKDSLKRMNAQELATKLGVDSVDDKLAAAEKLLVKWVSTRGSVKEHFAKEFADAKEKCGADTAKIDAKYKELKKSEPTIATLAVDSIAGNKDNVSESAEDSANEKVTRIITDIAQKYLGISSLSRFDRDELDFHDIHVGSIKSALREAFKRGLQAGRTIEK